MQDKPLLTLQVEHGGSRLDMFLAKALPDVSRARIQKAIAAEAILLNGAVASQRTALTAGDCITVNQEFFAPKHPQPEERPLDILYEDECLAVINKPAGMVVHPDASSVSGTLVNAMLAHWHEDGYWLMMDEEMRPGIVHRLDKDTSGAIAVARNRETYEKLKQAFQEHRIHKWYLAVVAGCMMPVAGRIDLPLGPSPRSWRRRAVLREGGKEAMTEYETVAVGQGCSLLKVRILTGRTHQIRVHCSHLGHPVVGDELYGGCQPSFADVTTRQLLHSWRLSFVHPLSGKIVKVQAPLPEDFKAALKKLDLNRI